MRAARALQILESSNAAERRTFLRHARTIHVNRDHYKSVTHSSYVNASPSWDSALEAPFGCTVCNSPAMQRLLPLCRRVAETDVPVLIEGETGTGKEIMARSIHDESGRRQRPFVVFDCTTVSPKLIESALFGHQRGAFTGAVVDTKGVFESANGGTLFIDEIGDLPAKLQPKLLRALDRAEVQRIGSSHWTKVDVRVIAATRRNLEHEIRKGAFRDDLFYRLVVARIELPPLRARGDDVKLLAGVFWNQLMPSAGPMPDDLLSGLEVYEWPGNIRELRNLVTRRAALGVLEPPLSSFCLNLGENPSANEHDVISHVLDLKLPLGEARAMVVEAFERRYLQRLVSEHEGNATSAAAAAGIARRYFQLLRSRHQA
ncbi:MAG TPA: sigma-54 dependent transcriptional regulator [Polyangia bacterium]